MCSKKCFTYPIFYFFLFFEGGGSKSKKILLPIFLPFNPILNNFEFFHVWQKMFYIPYFFFGGGAKNPKIISTIFLPFQAICNNLDFFSKISPFGTYPGGWVGGSDKSRIKLNSVQQSWSLAEAWTELGKNNHVNRIKKKYFDSNLY